jgi:hypothetical protein
MIHHFHTPHAAMLSITTISLIFAIFHARYAMPPFIAVYFADDDDSFLFTPATPPFHISAARCRRFLHFAIDFVIARAADVSASAKYAFGRQRAVFFSQLAGMRLRHFDRHYEISLPPPAPTFRRRLRLSAILRHAIRRFLQDYAFFDAFHAGFFIFAAAFSFRARP